MPNALITGKIMEPKNELELAKHRAFVLLSDELQSAIRNTSVPPKIRKAYVSILNALIDTLTGRK